MKLPRRDNLRCGCSDVGLAIPAKTTIFASMLKAFDFRMPTRGTKVPSAPDWLHEVKYDGYRLRVERNGDRVRLIARNGYDWTNRYPWIVEAALKNRQSNSSSMARRSLSASTAFLISMRSIRVGRMTRCSSTPSISWR